MSARTISLLYGCLIIALYLGNLLFFIGKVESLSPLILGAVMVVQTILATGVFIVAHDSMHGLIGESKRVNDAVGWIACGIYAAFSFRKMRSYHHAHHEHTGSDKDPDYPGDGQEGFLKWLWLFLKRYYGLREFIYMHIHIGVLYYLAGSLSHVILLFAIPVWLSAVQLFYFGTYLPHKGFEGISENPKLNPPARSNSLPTVLSLLTCFHFGYHYEHHRYPHLAWWQLPKARWKKGVSQ